MMTEIQKKTADGLRAVEALAFINSARGKYILSQALAVAIDTMSKVESPHKEVSNIADMEFILDNLFPQFAVIHRMEVPR